MSFRSIRALSLLFLSTLTIATVGTGATIYFGVLQIVDELVDQRITDMSDEISPEGASANVATVKANISHAASTRTTGDLGYILWKGGRQIAGNIRIGRKLPRGYADVDVLDHIAGLTTGRSFTRDLGQDLSLSVVGETEPVDHYHHWLLRIYLLGFASIIIVGAVATYVLSTSIARRIAGIRQTTEAIIEGDLTQRVPMGSSGSEFDQLARTFNRMLGRLEEQIAEICNMSNMIAHEMRTPLTRLRNQLSLITANSDVAVPPSRIEPALGQADELLATFSSLLRIADIESGRTREGFALVDLDEIISECIDALSAVAEESGHVLTWEPVSQCPMRGDRALLTQMMINLIENAICHTPAQSKIAVDVKLEGGRIALCVIDDGPGIAPEERERALSRFGRLGKSSAAGNGLGLSLVHAIVNLHHGTLALADARPGLRVEISFPAV